MMLVVAEQRPAEPHGEEVDARPHRPDGYVGSERLLLQRRLEGNDGRDHRFGHQRVGVVAEVLEGHVAGTEVAFLEGKEGDAEALANAARHAVHRALVAEYHHRTWPVQAEQLLVPGLQLAHAAAVPDRPVGAVADHVAEVVLHLEHGDAVGRADEAREGAKKSTYRTLQQYHRRIHESTVRQHTFIRTHFNKRAILCRQTELR